MKAHPLSELYLHRSWNEQPKPKKILAMRFHAFGDVVITLPYLQALKNSLPDTEMHLLTREECADIPRHAPMFSKVFALDDHRSSARSAALVLRLLPALARERYDAVLDLQRNRLSRLVRRALFPKSFSEFDRYSTLSAGERVRRTIDALGLASLPHELPDVALRQTGTPRNHVAWRSAGYREGIRFIILNPAGSSSSKNWPIERYAAFARLWSDTIDSGTMFMLIGTDRIAGKAALLKQRLPGRVIDLVNATSAAEALMLVKKADFVLTEDSGLMHMAWISRVPLVALFGSTPAVWSAPLGETSVCLDSSDLECGGCSKSECMFGDVHCLARYSPEFVLETARRLLERIETDVGRIDSQ